VLGLQDVDKEFKRALALQEWIVHNDWDYFFKRFSLRFFLFSSLSFLVIGLFLALPMLNTITTLN
jgi:hypothetical protein